MADKNDGKKTTKTTKTPANKGKEQKTSTGKKKPLTGAAKQNSLLKKVKDGMAAAEELTRPDKAVASAGKSKSAPKKKTATK